MSDKPKISLMGLYASSLPPDEQAYFGKASLALIGLMEVLRQPMRSDAMLCAHMAGAMAAFGNLDIEAIVAEVRASYVAACEGRDRLAGEEEARNAGRH